MGVSQRLGWTGAAIPEWFYQGWNIFDVMRLAGHSKYETTCRFYLRVADGLMDRVRKATRRTVSSERLQKCCSGVSDARKRRGLPCVNT